jgi:hypothetical protein
VGDGSSEAKQSRSCVDGRRVCDERERVGLADLEAVALDEWSTGGSGSSMELSFTAP